jgi:hypothetical protein
MRLPLPLTVATAGATLALTASASAAYAPQLQIKLDPPTAGKAPAITSVVSQKSGETPSKTVRVSFPAGFGPQLGAKVATCQPADEANRACPPDTQLGTAKASALVLGLPAEFAGTVHLAGVQGATFRLVIFLHSDTFGDQKIVGQAANRPDGGYDTTFDNLPDTLVTHFELDLAGGEKALLQNPSTCGTYLFKAAFTSQQGEQASGQFPVDIGGCAAKTARPLALGAVKLAADGSVRFTLSAPAKGTVTVKRGARKVVAKAFTGVAGANRVRTRKLKPGRYVVAITATGADGKALRRRYNRSVAR